MSEYDDFFLLLKSSKRTAVLTGAGISTLSGIPDFRSSGGLYSKKFGELRVEDLLDIDFFLKHPEEFYAWAKSGWYSSEIYTPNIVHETLRKMEDKGLLSDGIWTQNIDSLDTICGSKHVHELHGSLAHSTCTLCGRKYTFDETRKRLEGNDYPKCDCCRGLLKPDIVFYGENLDNSLITESYEVFGSADLVIILGSSLVVQPVATLPLLTLDGGGKIVIVNRDSTYLDRNAAFKFNDLKDWGEKTYDFLEKC